MRMKTYFKAWDIDRFKRPARVKNGTCEHGCCDWCPHGCFDQAQQMRDDEAARAWLKLKRKIMQR